MPDTSPAPRSTSTAGPTCADVVQHGRHSLRKLHLTAAPGKHTPGQDRGSPRATPPHPGRRRHSPTRQSYRPSDWPTRTPRHRLTIKGHGKPLSSAVPAAANGRGRCCLLPARASAERRRTDLKLAEDAAPIRRQPVPTAAQPVMQSRDVPRPRRAAGTAGHLGGSARGRSRERCPEASHPPDPISTDRCHHS